MAEELGLVRRAEDSYLNDAEVHAEVQRAFRVLAAAVRAVDQEIPEEHHRPILLGALVALHLRDQGGQE